jgi:hypothetical protein
MSRVKNISGGVLDVPLLGRQVEDGEIVEVPDFQPDSTDEEPLPIVWPDNRWEPVTDDTAAEAGTGVLLPGGATASAEPDTAAADETTGGVAF